MCGVEMSGKQRERERKREGRKEGTPTPTCCFGSERIVDLRVCNNVQAVPMKYKGNCMYRGQRRT